MSYAADFHPYGLSHWVALAVFVAGCVALVRIGRSQRGSEQARGFGKAFALTVMLVTIMTQAYVLLPEGRSLDATLPLHLCDLAWMIAIVALWTGGPRAYALVYYWGLTLSVQGLIMPVLTGPDYPHIDYLGFFGEHLLIVWTAVYLTWGLGMRPDWSGFRFTVVVTAGWAVAMLGFNSIAGTNFGFLNRKPDGGSILDLMGDWPWYLLVEVAAILVAWALITWPWTRTRAGLASEPGPWSRRLRRIRQVRGRDR